METATAERRRKAIDDGFEQFLEQPLTQLVLSMIPPHENPDMLRQVVKAAYETGFNAGGGEMAVQVADAFLKRRDKDR